MAHLARGVVAMPMVVGEGHRGPEQSRHHPNAGPGAENPTQSDARSSAGGNEDEGSDWEINNIKEKIISAVQSEIAGEVEGMIKRLVQLGEERGREQRGNGDLPTDQPTMISKLYNALTSRLKTIEKRIEIPQPARLQPRSWASIVSGATSPSADAAWAPRKVVPARHTRELVIKTRGNNPPETAAEVVLKVNLALRSSEALAARRLQSGDIVLSFKNNAEAHVQDDTWVRAAFGDQAMIAKRTYAVLMKGIPRSIIEKRMEGEIRTDIERANEVKVAGCRKRLPRSKEARYSALLVEVEAIIIAQQLYSLGAVLEAQIFNCKPYSGDLQVL